MESGKGRKLSGEVEPSKEKKKIRISIPTDQENQSCLRARVEELRNETYWLCYELEGLSKICMRTRESNTNLLENLKMICGAEVIHAIEEKNPDPDPDPDPQTDDDDDQRRGTPNEII